MDELIKDKDGLPAVGEANLSEVHLERQSLNDGEVSLVKAHGYLTVLANAMGDILNRKRTNIRVSNDREPLSRLAVEAIALLESALPLLEEAEQELPVVTQSIALPHVAGQTYQSEEGRFCE